MDSLEAVKMFVAAIDEGSLAKAGHALGRSPAALTRAVAHLEAEAGERLIHRSPRGLALTAEGRRHLEAYRHIIETWSALHAGNDAGKLRGSIAITAPELFGRANVLPLVEEFLDLHPGVHARMLLRNDVLDLVAHGVDVAVRLAELADSNLVAVKLGSMRQVICASPAHLANHPPPRLPSDLRDCLCIGVKGAGSRELWPLASRADGTGRGRSVAVPTRLSIDSAAAVLECVRSGRGIGQFMAYQVADDLAEGRLVRLLADYEPEPTPVHILYHGHARRHPRVRNFLDHASGRLRDKLADIQAMLG